MAEWKICCDGYYPYCSECNEEPPYKIMTDYCPNCGAYMIGTDDSNATNKSIALKYICASCISKDFCSKYGIYECAFDHYLPHLQCDNDKCKFFKNKVCSLGINSEYCGASGYLMEEFD